jgi:hypothetical protein
LDLGIGTVLMQILIWYVILGAACLDMTLFCFYQFRVGGIYYYFVFLFRGDLAQLCSKTW